MWQHFTYISMLIIWVPMKQGLLIQLSDVSRIARRQFDERARAIGATRAQWKTLTTLSRNEGMNQGGLADLLEIEPITLCRMIDRLEDAGLVERRRDPGDRRAWNVFLTEASRPMLTDLRAIADDLTAGALEGIDAADQAKFADILARIRTNLQTPSPNQETAHG
ncbi:Transcriptional regulator [Sphingomonas sp. EC-HK361]|nr:Transcriptional regulator [Sphingomonas sp. EC-HK361]